MKQFGLPEIIFEYFSVTDTLTTSIIPTDATGGGEITLPADPFDEEPIE